MSDSKEEPVPAQAPLVEGLDYYIEKGRYVFTAHYLQKRGFCCQNGCRHCPYSTQSPQPTSNPNTSLPAM